MKKRFKLTKKEARLVRIGLRIYKDSLKVGPVYEPWTDAYKKRTAESFRREAAQCKRDLKIVKDLLTDLKGM